jgi:diadenosine tetraphosphate (Ap4A) HIT family hydrolase
MPTEKENCEFCKLLKEDSFKKENRLIRENEFCIAVLDHKPQRRCHVLVILKNHKKDLSDKNLSKEELKNFIDMIHKMCKCLKERIKDKNQKSPDRIYVCSLCDGVEHLHAYLIPRYPYTTKDKEFYKKLYPKKEIKPGFWYLCLGEKERKDLGDSDKKYCIGEMKGF